MKMVEDPPPSRLEYSPQRVTALGGKPKEAEAVPTGKCRHTSTGNFRRETVLPYLQCAPKRMTAVGGDSKDKVMGTEPKKVKKWKL